MVGVVGVVEVVGVEEVEEMVAAQAAAVSVDTKIKLFVVVMKQNIEHIMFKYLL